jgi:hypothetical protein
MAGMVEMRSDWCLNKRKELSLLSRNEIILRKKCAASVVINDWRSMIGDARRVLHGEEQSSLGETNDMGLNFSI